MGDPTLLMASIYHVHFLWTVMPDIITALNNAESWFPYPKLVLFVINKCRCRFSPCLWFLSPSLRSTFICRSVSWEGRKRREKQCRKKLPNQRKHLPIPSLMHPLPPTLLQVRKPRKPFAREKLLLVNKPASNLSQYNSILFNGVLLFAWQTNRGKGWSSSVYFLSCCRYE